MPSIDAPKPSMARLSIEVVCAWRDCQDIVHLGLEEHATALDALRASGLLQRFPELSLSEPAIGIFGRRVPPGTPLKDGDRVEVYRPLMLDPKEARRAKVSAKRRAKATATRRPKR
jgi:putative ubiquitin-RnfH superfamily antitoxin RatB of RatAB toxin-antitoxin module